MDIEKISNYYSPQNNIYSDNLENLSIQNGITDTVGNINFTRPFRFMQGFKETTLTSEKVIVHAHPFYEMHFLIKRPAEIYINDNSVILTPGDALIISPDAYHHYEPQTEQMFIATTQFYVSKNKNNIQPDYYDIFISKLKENNGYLLLENADKLLSFVHMLTENYHHLGPNLIMDFVNPLFHLIFSELTLQICGDSEKINHNVNVISEPNLRMQTIEYYIFSNYMNDPSLSELAKVVRLSEKQMGRIIKKHYGVDFRTHILNVRLHNAKRLIKESDMSLDDISAAVGFKTYSGFYLAFKKKYEITPGEYRKIKQQQAQTEK